MNYKNSKTNLFNKDAIIKMLNLEFQIKVFTNSTL